MTSSLNSKLQFIFLALFASSFRVTEEDLLSETAVWPTLFLFNVSTVLKETHDYILFVVSAAGVVPCDSPRKRARTSSIVQFIFDFWFFEISRNILRNQKTLSV